MPCANVSFKGTQVVLLCKKNKKKTEITLNKYRMTNEPYKNYFYS